MDGFWPSLLPYLRKFGLETVFILVAITIVLFSYTGFQHQQKMQQNPVAPVITLPTLIPATCFVDISGAINKPDIYELPCNKRLVDVIKRAGGLSEEADKPFIARNFNFARYIFDQEKIHIPFTWEINEAIFLENKRTIDYTSPMQTENLSQESKDKISLSLSSVEELEILPGIGTVTAQKIIDNRPYSSINDLVTKKVVNKTVFEKIKSYIIE